MPFDTYGATATLLTDTIAATQDLSLTTEDNDVPTCCATANPCSPYPVDVTINNTELTLAESGASWRQEVVTFTALQATLTYTPISRYSVLLFINGVLQHNPADYTIVGKVITLIASPPPTYKAIVSYLSTDSTSTIGAETGMIIGWASDLDLPAGWLECDGTAISRTTYDELFAAIGTDYGAGDGSTTFNLPTLDGEFFDGVATVAKTAIIKY